MIQPSQIREHMEILGSDGQQVGKVDHMDGSTRIKLAKQDTAARGQHHFVPLDWVKSVDGQTVRLSKSSQEVRQQWQKEGAGAGQRS